MTSAKKYLIKKAIIDENGSLIYLNTQDLEELLIGYSEYVIEGCIKSINKREIKKGK